MMNKETAALFILGSHDVQEILMINRQRLSKLVDTGKLTPFKVLKREMLFWKPEVEALRIEMMKDTRTNLHKVKMNPEYVSNHLKGGITNV